MNPRTSMGPPSRAALLARAMGALALVVLPLAALTLCAAPAAAREGDSRFGLHLGTTTFSVSGYRTFGTTFGGSYGYEFADNLLWTLGAGFTSADGEAVITDADGNQTPVVLKATTAQATTGLLAFFRNAQGNLLIPFVGGGLSWLNYDLEYPGTTVGVTSGTGPGAYMQAGVELRLTRSVTLIPSLSVQVHSIDTESGDSVGLVSGGLVFAFRIST